MEGKIFADSGNIYQDQAKILYNYYKQAAEKIVAEEERIEKEIAILNEERLKLEKGISGLWVWFLTIILFFIYFVKKSSLQKQIAGIDIRIAEFKKQHDEIFRDYKVTKLGVAYVPIAEQIKYEDKSFIVDYTGNVEESEVTLQMSRRNDLLVETIGNIDKLTAEAPIVEKSDDTEALDTDDYSTSIQKVNQYDYFGGLERSLRTISFCMDDIDRASVSLPLVIADSQYLGFVKEFAAKNLPDGAPVINVFSKERYVASIEKFQKLNKLKDSLSTKTQQFEDVLKSLMASMAGSVQAISALKVASVDKVVFESNNILFDILKAPYNQYSPMLEHEEIERIRNEKFDYSEDVQSYEPFNLKQSSRMRYNLLTGLWTSEDGNTTNMPFGVHQIYEEIVAPVVQNLMEENRIERLKIYNHIKDQKMSYLNKWHQDTDAFYRANRAESADIINLMQESLREYVTAYNTLVSLQKTENSMATEGSLDSTVVNVVDNSAETLTAFEMQSQEFQKTQNDFEDYIDRLKDDIDLKAERFGHVEYYDAKLRDGYSNEVAVATSEIHQLDQRRKSLANVNPLFAKKSELPPQPNVEEITFEHISLNLPAIAKRTLEELGNMDNYVIEQKTVTDDEGYTREDLEAMTDDELKALLDSADIEYDADDFDREEAIDSLLDEGDEETDESDDDEEDEDEDEYYTREDLEAMTDDELKALLDSADIEYDADDFDREEAIDSLLDEGDEGEEEEGGEETDESDDDEEDEDEDEYYTREDLEAMTDEELQSLLDSADIEYDADNFDRQKAIDDILNYDDEDDDNNN